MYVFCPANETVSVREHKCVEIEVKKKMFCLQIGNAVPPPMAKFIGLEIQKCLEQKTQREKAQLELAKTPLKTEPIELGEED